MSAVSENTISTLNTWKKIGTIIGSLGLVVAVASLFFIDTHGTLAQNSTMLSILGSGFIVGFVGLVIYCCSSSKKDEDTSPKVETGQSKTSITVYTTKSRGIKITAQGMANLLEHGCSHPV